MIKLIPIALWAGLVATLLPAQTPPAPAPQLTDVASDKLRPTYVLGPGDQVTIHAFEVEEIGDRPFRIDSEGDINLPVLGKVHPGGLTVEQFEAALTQRLKVIVKDPQVVVNVAQFRSEPVFFSGAFKAPGVYALQGRRTLVEMLASIGGTSPNASHRIKVSRQMEFGRIPLTNAVVQPDGKVSTVEISMESLTGNISPPEDIVLQPYDHISVERSELVYANGEFNKVGGIELGERDSISITQLISMAGGLTKDAAPDKATILRPVLDTSRRAEIPVDLKKIFSGRDADSRLLPNDVLYVPPSRHKINWTNTTLVAAPVLTTLLYILATRL
jgi:polysaccharide export outer membrane protein